jgi:hypothetical protein
MKYKFEGIWEDVAIVYFKAITCRKTIQNLNYYNWDVGSNWGR